jgi:hypothetical protein
VPTLPSGIELALLVDHIMEPDRNWFKAPEGHFWYWTPADENTPPFDPNQEWEGVPTTASIPTCRDEMAQCIRVCIGLGNRMMYWRGDMLADFPAYCELSEDDLDSWKDWVNTARVQDFIDSTIIKCQTQAEINKEATGLPVFQGVKGETNGEAIVAKVIDNPLKNSH